MRSLCSLLFIAFIASAALASCAREPAPRCPATPAATAIASAPPTCGATHATTASLAPSSSASSSRPRHRPPPPDAFTSAMQAAKQAIGAHDYATADRQLDAASKAAPDDPHFHSIVAYLRATRFTYEGDFERAASAFVAVIPELAQHPESDDEFWAHNAMMMIREAQGDPASALAENDQATLAAARGTWEPDDRETLAYTKDRWHRAYLSRMLAETRTGSARQALVNYAASALADYTTRARAVGGYEDSIAILEAYFAALDGRRDDALAAAKKVDAAKDGDLEDLYLVVIGLEAGGDHAAAEAVRKIMRQPGSMYLALPIMLGWLDHDQAHDTTFTPWHPR